MHYYAIPFHLLADVTDKGTLWDVTKNSYIYKWNMTSDVLTPSRETPLAPVEWFHFEGRWGDRFYPLSDRRQYRVAGQYRRFLSFYLRSRMLNIALGTQTTSMALQDLNSRISTVRRSARMKASVLSSQA